jgi:hypothetical protein
VIRRYLELTRQLDFNFYDDLPTTPELYANGPLPFPVEMKMQGAKEEKGKEKGKGYTPPHSPYLPTLSLVQHGFFFDPTKDREVQPV